ITTQAVVSYAQEKKRPTIFGVSYSYHGIDKTEVEKGRFFSEDEDSSASQVAVLGSDIAETFFGNQDPIEKSIKIDGKAYRVVGVMESIGTTGFVNMDETVYLPVTTVQKKLMGIDYVLWIVAQTKDNTKAESTAEEIRSLMREQHNITDESKEDFAVTTMNEALAIVETILIGITGLLIVLASISLIVGGVGIMNVMYVSVVERTFEIGLRKAVGARDKDILYQFLTEAVCLTLLGGIGGIILGIGISYLVALIASVIGFDWQFEVSIFSVLLSVIFCISVGLFFGLYPARQAAQLDPVVALRKE
ncbi:MAG: ABC transporter permease, partial [Candidatus Magasanikbacteria bacterium]|nr:ABC transporter permease [Candidatus Magasanikbacteria bacterium]